MEPAGKTLLLTGATGGLGRAIAQVLAARGASLVLSSRRAAELESLAAELPGEHRVCVSDLAEPGAALAVLEAAGAVDGLIANAALPGSGRLDDLEPEHVVRALRVNLEAPMLLAQGMLPRLRERGAGHIVLVSSLNGRAAAPRTSVYSATKFGLRGFGLALREDLRDTGVGVSVVLPGFIREAGMFADSGARAPAVMGTSTPQEVADAVLRAIRKDRAEIDVAPVRAVAAARFAAGLPELAGRISHSTAVKAADQVAGGQTDKR